MANVITYIDGFNLYFGMKKEFGNKYLWLNVEELSRLLINPGDTLVAVKYFTSRVTNQPDKERRQNIYLEALMVATQCEIYYGRYQPNITNCKRCGANWPSPKEKMTDVNIATQMIKDAFTNEFETALLISGDSDLLPPLNTIKSYLPHKRIGIYFPPKRHSIHLQPASDFNGYIGNKKLRDSQLPSQIIKANGFILNRPTSWV